MKHFRIVKCNNCGARNLVIQFKIKSKEDKTIQWNCCENPDVR